MNEENRSETALGFIILILFGLVIIYWGLTGTFISLDSLFFIAVYLLFLCFIAFNPIALITYALFLYLTAY
jgi:hypothetical protein